MSRLLCMACGAGCGLRVQLSDVSGRGPFARVGTQARRPVPVGLVHLMATVPRSERHCSHGFETGARMSCLVCSHVVGSVSC